MTAKARNVTFNRWWDVWAAFFVISAITLVGLRLWATEWTSDLYIIVYLVFLAGISGLALGYSRFSTPLALLFAAVYGTFFTGWLFGTTVKLEMSWRDRILNYLGWRLRLAIQQFNAGEAVSDPILFLTIMAILLWFLGFSTAFILIRRRSIWPALIPLGLTLLIIGHYDQDLARNTRFVMAFLFFTLLLLGRVTFLRYREKWRQEGIHTTYELQLDFAKAMLVLVALLLFLSWIIPITPQQVNRYSELWDRISEPWEKFRDQLSDLFIPENATNFSAAAYYGDNLSLGLGSPASEEILFSVETEDIEIPGLRYYWQARSYDSYQDDAWTSSPGLPTADFYPETFNIRYPEWQDGQTIFYTVTTEVSRIINVYTSGAPIWVSRPVEAIYQPLGNENEDLIALTTDPPMALGETYQVESWVSIPTIRQLQETPTDYPTWLDRYLALPEDFSPRITALAEEITAGLDNPYDKAYAITRYLRTTIDYSRTIPPIPADADPMEWFLFDGQVGFCNYYASAQVLMLRAVGIPARMSVGYAQGTFDSQTNTYTVRKQDSHAWPEVYFLNYGWVIFEPTVSQPPLVLPAGEAPAGEEEAPGSEEDSPDLPPQDLDILMDELPDGSLADDPANAAPEPVRRVQGPRVIWTLLFIFLAALLITILVLLRPTYFKLEVDPLPVLLERALTQRGKAVPPWLRKWSRIARMSSAERAYLQMDRAIRWLGEKVNPAETPLERAQTVTALLPAAADASAAIIREYQLDQFSDHIVNEDRAKNAARVLRGLAFKAAVNRVFQRNRNK